jgi:hypothetical protein
MPAFARCAAIPAPIVPAPRTAAFDTVIVAGGGTVFSLSKAGFAVFAIRFFLSLWCESLCSEL